MTVIVLAVVASPIARAQHSAAEAEQLFRDGKALMKQGKYAEACVAFETSQTADPAITTLLNLADCREKNGQVASAWSLFLEAARQTRDDAKNAAFHETATERASKLEAKLSYLTVSVPKESEVDGLALTRNGAEFAEGMWNRAIPVDGGEYVIAGRAPGHEEWSTTVTMPPENGRVSVDVPKFKEVAELVEPVTAPIAPRAVESPVVPAPALAARTETSSSLTGRRKLALAAAGTAVLAVGGGIVFGLQMNDLEDEALRLCPDNPCGANAVEANGIKSRAETRATLANVSYGVAAAAGIGAVVLWLTGAPSHARLTPVATERYLGLDLAVRF